MKSLFSLFLLIFLLTFDPTNVMSQANINIKIKNLESSLSNDYKKEEHVLYLIKYKSDKTQIVIDSSYKSHKKFTFKNKKGYDEGIYVIANEDKQPLFEILIGSDQKFSITIENLMDYGTYKAKGSKETALYFDVNAKTIHDNLYIKALENEIKHNSNNIVKIDSIKRQLYDYQESKLIKDSDSFLNTYIKFIEAEPGNAFEHYFDDLPLCDVRLLNSRLLKNKLDNYFNVHTKSQNPDFISQKIDELLSKVKDCKEVRDYILWYLYSRYFNTDNANDELIYIHLVDNFFSKLDIKNLTQNIRNEIIRRADIIRNITIGHSVPPLLIIDDEGNEIKLDDLDSEYTVLFFYKPECQNCIRDKRILGLVEKRRKDLNVIKIDITDEGKYHEIINTYNINTTPEIYIIDKNKKIITKGVSADKIEFYTTKK